MANSLHTPTVTHTRAAKNAVAVTPSDSADLNPFACFGIYIGGTGSGNLKVDVVGSGSAIVFKGLTAGTFLPVQVRRVYSTGTDVTDIVALF